MKREQGKAAFAFLPSRLTSRRYLSCGTGEAPSLGGAASSQGDFLGFIDSTCISAFPLVKVMFASTELDHLMKNLCKVFEVFSFLTGQLAILFFGPPLSVSPVHSQGDTTHRPPEKFDAGPSGAVF